MLPYAGGGETHERVDDAGDESTPSTPILPMGARGQAGFTPTRGQSSASGHDSQAGRRASQIPRPCSISR